MNKTLFLGMAMAILATPACNVGFHTSSQSLPNNVTYTVHNAEFGAPERQYQVGHFDELCLESAFDCTFIVSDSCRLFMASDNEELLKHVCVNKTNGLLSIGLDDFFSLGQMKPIGITISAPSLNSLAMSGSCHFACHDTLRAAGNLNFDLSGASNVEVHTCKAARIDIDASGACKFIANVKADSLFFDASGATQASLFVIGCQKSSIDLSGASNISMEFANGCGDVTYNASGTCVATFGGNVRSLQSNVSGVSQIDTADLNIEEK